MFITGKCKKCRKRVAFDIGEMHIDEAIKLIRNMSMSECIGGHMEIGTYGDHYTLNENILFRNKEDALLMEVA